MKKRKGFAAILIAGTVSALLALYVLAGLLSGIYRGAPADAIWFFYLAAMGLVMAGCCIFIKSKSMAGVWQLVGLSALLLAAGAFLSVLQDGIELTAALIKNTAFYRLAGGLAITAVKAATFVLLLRLGLRCFGIGKKSGKGKIIAVLVLAVAEWLLTAVQLQLVWAGIADVVSMLLYVPFVFLFWGHTLPRPRKEKAAREKSLQSTEEQRIALKNRYEQGGITETEYNAARQALLSDL